MMKKICPLCFSNSDPDMLYQKCENEKCAWWSEDSQKCAILILAESQRKVMKGK